MNTGTAIASLVDSANLTLTVPFAAEDAEQAGLINAMRCFLIWQRSVGRISALLNPLTYILINIGLWC